MLKSNKELFNLWTQSIYYGEYHQMYQKSIGCISIGLKQWMELIGMKSLHYYDYTKDEIVELHKNAKEVAELNIVCA